MKYNDIRVLLKTKGISAIDADIAMSVDMALDGEKPLNEEDFNALCKFVHYVWDNVEKGYTQLIADIVVDLFVDCSFGYRDEEATTTVIEAEVPHYLTLEDIKKLDWEKRQMVINIFYDAYYS